MTPSERRTWRIIDAYRKASVGSKNNPWLAWREGWTAGYRAAQRDARRKAKEKKR